MNNIYGSATFLPLELYLIRLCALESRSTGYETMSNLAMGVLEDLKEGLAVYSGANHGSKLTESNMAGVLPGNPHHLPVQHSPLNFQLNLLDRPWFYNLWVIQGNSLEETRSSSAESFSCHG
ncbi:hypothetical protein N7G274_005945 [Stereocaulon virgatum]|uniref:Uncharacterized protein n=1 Tax=Stereocaulon virgatum TaxID=373712 RepID=A0ABR4A7A9_9LECA